MSDQDINKDIPACSDCGCEDATLVVYPGTPKIPEYKMWHCANCDKPLSQPE